MTQTANASVESELNALEKNAWKSIIRSLMSFAISTLISVVAHFGFHLDQTTALRLLIAVGAGLTVVLHLVEIKWPKFGILLGWLGAPQYAPSGKTAIAAQLATTQADLAKALADLEVEKAKPKAPTPVLSLATDSPSTP